MKKIMFNDDVYLTGMVIVGLKTMTRRVCKEYATKQPILARDVDSYAYYPKENVVEFSLIHLIK